MRDRGVRDKGQSEWDKQDEWEAQEERNEYVMCLVRLIGSAVTVVLCLSVLVFLLFGGTKSGDVNQREDGTQNAGETNTEQQGVEQEGNLTGQQEDGDSGDPQGALAGNMGDDTGASVEIAEILSASTLQEMDKLSYGIDVAKYQGTIDWEQVAQAGIDFAMVRVGYRTMDTGEIMADTNAKYNLQEAGKNGIQTGAYFFSTAITEEEAKEEADWVAEYVSQYRITYPIAYNCEGFDRPESRQYYLSLDERSGIAAAFLDRIYEKGYTPMFYAARNELLYSMKWDTKTLESRYKIWVAQYPVSVEGSQPDYSGAYAMWQYTNQGTVPGISLPVDMNIAYFGYEGMEEAKNSEAPEEAKADVEALMNFTEVAETVTAKDATNLRNIPSQGEDSLVVHTLQNGETATRTGISASGWSRVIYDGQTLYAVSNYLTTDLTVQAPEPDDGIKTKFQDCNETVTAKIEVNLRTLPSVTNPDSQVAAVLTNGEYVTRTGINTDYGWSRVDYNGQTLYCVSSYLSVEE